MSDPQTPDDGPDAAPPRHFLLHPFTAVLATGDGYVVTKPGAGSMALAGDDARAADGLLAALRGPVSEADLAPHLAPSSGDGDGDGDSDGDSDSARVRALFDRLGDGGFAIAGPEDRLRPLVPGPGSHERLCARIVLGICGTSQAASVLPYAAELRAMCDQLDVVLTASATRFLQPAVFEHLGIRTWTEAFSVRGDVRVPHIQLARDADITVVIPASAHLLHRAAHGACSDLLSLILCATRAPVVLAPSMNHAMWNSPAVRRNVAQLREDGFWIAQPRDAVSVTSRHERDLSLALGLPLPSLRAALADVLARTSGNFPVIQGD